MALKVIFKDGSEVEYVEGVMVRIESDGTHRVVNQAGETIAEIDQKDYGTEVAV